LRACSCSRIRSHERALFRDTAKYVEPVGGGVRRQEVGNGVLAASRSAEKLNGPFGDALAANVHIPARLGLVDVLVLTDERQRLLGPCSLLGEGQSLCAGPKGTEVVRPACEIGRDRVPNVPPAGCCMGRPGVGARARSASASERMQSHAKGSTTDASSWTSATRCWRGAQGKQLASRLEAKQHHQVTPAPRRSSSISIAVAVPSP
jgi:hypothetical protein